MPDVSGAMKLQDMKPVNNQIYRNGTHNLYSVRFQSFKCVDKFLCYHITVAMATMYTIGEYTDYCNVIIAKITINLEALTGVLYSF